MGARQFTGTPYGLIFNETAQTNSGAHPHSPPWEGAMSKPACCRWLRPCGHRYMSNSRPMARCYRSTLIHAFTSSRLDYCNSILAGDSGELLQKLHVVQNAAGLLVTGARKCERMTPVRSAPKRSTPQDKLLMATPKRCWVGTRRLLRGAL